jgi:hypothetical protein
MSARFRFHLSTAVFLMIVASILIFLNVQGYNPPLSKEQFMHEVFTSTANGLTAKMAAEPYYGWPFIFYDERGGNPFSPNGGWFYGALALDIASWVGTLILVAVICELLIRHHETRKL